MNDRYDSDRREAVDRTERSSDAENRGQNRRERQGHETDRDRQGGDRGWLHGMFSRGESDDVGAQGPDRRESERRQTEGQQGSSGDTSWGRGSGTTTDRDRRRGQHSGGEQGDSPQRGRSQQQQSGRHGQQRGDRGQQETQQRGQQSDRRRGKQSGRRRGHSERQQGGRQQHSGFETDAINEANLEYGGEARHEQRRGGQQGGMQGQQGGMQDQQDQRGQQRNTQNRQDQQRQGGMQGHRGKQSQQRTQSDSTSHTQGQQDQHHHGQQSGNQGEGQQNRSRWGGEQHGSQYQQGQPEYGRHQRSEGHESGMARDRGGDQRGGRSQRDYGDSQQFDRGGEYGSDDRSSGRMNREQQSGGGLEYQQQGRRSEQGNWMDSGESERGSSGDRNQQRQDDDMTNRRHVHERDPTADEDRARDEDWSS